MAGARRRATLDTIAMQWRRGMEDDGALRQEVERYRIALATSAKESDPLAWAATQNALGKALLSLGHRGDVQAPRDAVTAFRDALTERTRRRVPPDWAITQRHLGDALLRLGEYGDHDALGDAITTYREALEECTRARAARVGGDPEQPRKGPPEARPTWRRPGPARRPHCLSRGAEGTYPRARTARLGRDPVRPGHHPQHDWRKRR